jgi:hypothetical protein
VQGKPVANPKGSLTHPFSASDFTLSQGSLENRIVLHFK